MPDKDETEGSGGVDLVSSVSSPLHLVFEGGALRIARHDADLIRAGHMPEQMFFDAVMARVEVNRNKDNLTVRHLQEVAATLAHTPIDDEHRQSILQGHIIASWFDQDIPNKNGTTGALIASCVMSPRRFPQIAQGLLAGDIKFSIENTAKEVECSTCLARFSTDLPESAHCNHLKQRLMTGSTTSRGWIECRGIGAAFTRNPAGSDCYAQDGSIALVASYDPDSSPETTAQMLSASYILAAATKEPYGDVDYADPGYQPDGKKRYPIDTKEHAQAAWSYINQKDNGHHYSGTQLSHIKGKIRSAAQKFGITLEAHMELEQFNKLFAALLEAAKTDKEPDGDEPDDADMKAAKKTMKAGLAALKSYEQEKLTAALTSAEATAKVNLEAAVKTATDVGTAALATEKRMFALAALKNAVKEPESKRTLVASLSDEAWTALYESYQVAETALTASLVSTPVVPATPDPVGAAVLANAAQGTGTVMTAATQTPANTNPATPATGEFKLTDLTFVATPAVRPARS